MSLNVKLKM